jgi:hypothetical protein
LEEQAGGGGGLEECCCVGAGWLAAAAGDGSRGGGCEREAGRGTGRGMEGMNGNPRTSGYIVVYGAHVSVNFAGSWVGRYGYNFFKPAKFYLSGSNANPHPYPWVQIQTQILALVGFYPRERG